MGNFRLRLPLIGSSSMTLDWSVFALEGIASRGVAEAAGGEGDGAVGVATGSLQVAAERKINIPRTMCFFIPQH